MKNRSAFLFILLIWLVCTAINLEKAFHIDDTFHLEAAQWIAKHPLQPMSGSVNWTDVPEPVHRFNQPPLYLYIVAAAGSLFGFSEIPLHLVQSLFTLLALIFFFRIARIIAPGHEKFLTLLFAFCPAFIVNQNLMTDVPLVSLCLVFAWLLVRPGDSGEIRRYVLAALVFGLAVLVKYTVLPLFIVLAVSLLWKRKYQLLWTLLIPLAMLALWSWWNFREFGYIHIAGRNRDNFELNDFLATSLSVIACLGAVTPFALSFFSRIFRNGKPFKVLIPAVLVAFLLFCLLSWHGIVNAGLSKEILRYLFLLNGMALVTAIVVLAVKRLRTAGKTGSFDHTDAVLISWFAGIALFIIQFAPFIATRHILLIIPPVLLIGFRGNAVPPLSLKIQAAVVTIVLGLLLGISDRNLAGFYRDAANEIKTATPGEQQVWTAGHWGWQWYSKRQGMLEYASGDKKIHPGDYLVFPSDIARQHIDTSLRLVPVRKVWQKPSAWTFFSTGFYGSFYMSTYKHPAWRLSRVPADTVTVYRVIR